MSRGKSEPFLSLFVEHSSAVHVDLDATRKTEGPARFRGQQLAFGDQPLPCRQRGAWRNQKRNQLTALGHLDGFAGFDLVQVLTGVLPEFSNTDSLHPSRIALHVLHDPRGSGSKGQVTIPQAIRERYGLLPDTEVEFVESGGRVTLVPSPSKDTDRGSRAVARLRGSARSGMSTDEILALTRGGS